MERVVLAIETSTRSGSVAVWNDGQVLFDAAFYADRSHNSAVFGPLSEALAVFAEVGGGLVVAGTGPGSYTGARVGIAAGQGVAMVRGVAFGGVPSVCGADVAGDDFVVVGDARRGAFFWAEVRGRKLVGDPEVLQGRATLEERVSGASGPVVTFDEGLAVPGVEVVRPEAKLLVSCAGETVEGGPPVEPIYLRAPFVTTPKKRGLG